MSPITHFFVSWSVANIGRLNRRDRVLVTASGVVPDVDGLGILADMLTRNTQHPLHLWDRFHHILGHNLGLGIGTALCAFLLAERRWVAAFLALLAFHLHLLGDLVGARGPEGYQWPIPYLLPFSDAVQLAWDHQWALNAWPNFVLTGVILALSVYLAWRRGYSFVGLLSEREDQAFVKVLHTRFGAPKHGPHHDSASV